MAKDSEKPREKKKETVEKKTQTAMEIKQKGMERLSGTENKVDSSIMIMTEEGWKSIKINRSKIKY